MQSASDMYSSITDSDSDEEVKTESEGDFYFHNPKWPVWSRSSEGIPCEQLITLILSDAFTHPDKICKGRPVGVRHNALFVIALNCVSLKNLTADDNGSWDICTPRRMYQVEKSDIEHSVYQESKYNRAWCVHIISAIWHSQSHQKAKSCGFQTGDCYC